MTRRFGYMITACALLLALSACTASPAGSEPSYPTLPSFPQEQTPAQQLAAAIDKTRAAKSYLIQYGTRTCLGEEITQEDASQSVSQDSPLNWDEILIKLPGLAIHEGFMEAFCGRPLRAIPSNTGIIRYEVSDLSWEDARELLYADNRETENPEMRWTVALVVDAAGRLSEFEITSEGEGETRTVFLSITFPEDP